MKEHKVSRKEDEECVHPFDASFIIEALDEHMKRQAELETKMGGVNERNQVSMRNAKSAVEKLIERANMQNDTFCFVLRH